MKDVLFTDHLGRKFKVQAPDDLEEKDYKYGVFIGPPLLCNLGLPVQIEIELHNQLYNRGIFTLRDAKKRRHEVIAALATVLAIQADRILEAYVG